MFFVPRCVRRVFITNECDELFTSDWEKSLLLAMRSLRHTIVPVVITDYVASKVSSRSQQH